MGVRLVAANDSTGTAYRPEGLDVAELIRIKQQAGTILAYPGTHHLTSGEILEQRCGILIPATRPDVIRFDNGDWVQVRVILEGPNIPATKEAERLLHDRGILFIFYYIANAGGVICTAVESRGGSE